MRILGIETSCDETAAAVVEDGVKILATFTASSLELHKTTGGIVPEVAAREQIKYIVPLIEKTLRNISIKEIEAIAVTIGPGLIGSLLVGVETARTLSYAWKKPLIPVNHLVGHVYANFINSPSIEFPTVCLIVSGGHTELVLMEDHGKFKWIGGTRDDAAGEAFDKVARCLGLGFPGGPAIQQVALRGNPQAIPFPRPMISSNDFDLSFSGLKTAVINKLKSQSLTFKTADVAASFQAAAVDVLLAKTVKAAQAFNVKSILLAGGVAANKRLRELLGESAGNDYNVYIPPIDLCADNAVYIASCGFFNYKPISWERIKANPGLSLRTSP